jgi:nascent polypeptide-associated complex subunit alpha
MMPGLNPKKMQAMMKQLGMSQDEIDASKVTIDKTDGSQIIITDPSVVKINMQGQDSFQISGEINEGEPDNSEGDLKTVMEKTNASEKDAKKALEETDGDLAEAILKLSN